MMVGKALEKPVGRGGVFARAERRTGKASKKFFGGLRVRPANEINDAE